MRTLHPVMVIALALLSFGARAQGIRVIARNTADSVVLRWAPINATNWQIIDRRGYLVERIRIGEGVPNGAVERLSPDTLRPWSLEQMKERFPADHPNAPVVAQALYGRTFAPAPNVADMRTIEDGANELELRYAFAMFMADIDAGIAEALGLRLVDPTAQKGASYLYRVIAFASNRPDTAVIAVDRRLTADGTPHAPELRALELEQRIELTWSREGSQERFSAYIMERSQGNGPWRALSERPFLPTDGTSPLRDELFRYADTTVVNYVPYRYRLRGITPFGETSTPGPECNAMGRDRTAPPSPMLRDVQDVHGGLVVNWEQPVAADLAGFRVEKALVANGSFLPLHQGLLPPGARTFKDTSSFLIGENHYRIWALDTAGNEAVSLTGYGAVADSIAPMPPTELHGYIDTNGVVTVEWRAGKEKDLLGFRVFFANAADHEFHNLTPSPLPQTFFRDTIPLRTLTKRIYYRVVAVDRNFNHSEASAILALEKPDMVEPVAPVMADYLVTDTSVHFHFVASSSDDVAMHRVYRRMGNEGAWELRAELTGLKDRAEWTDHDVRGPQFLAYAVQAVDSAGNTSERTPPMLVRVTAPAQKQAVAEVVAVLMDDGFVNVRWSASAENLNHFVIYSSNNGGPTVAVGHVPADQRQFTDTRSSGKGSRTYLVKAVFTDGSATTPVPTREPLDVH